MSEKLLYLIIQSCLRLYISLQKWSLTLEHLSPHLKPRGICSFFWLHLKACVPKLMAYKMKMRFHTFFFPGHPQSSCEPLTSFPLMSATLRSGGLNSLSTTTMCVSIWRRGHEMDYKGQRLLFAWQFDVAPR